MDSGQSNGQPPEVGRENSNNQSTENRKRWNAKKQFYSIFGGSPETSTQTGGPRTLPNPWDEGVEIEHKQRASNKIRRGWNVTKDAFIDRRYSEQKKTLNKYTARFNTALDEVRRNKKGLDYLPPEMKKKVTKKVEQLFQSFDQKTNECLSDTTRGWKTLPQISSLMYQMENMKEALQKGIECWEHWKTVREQIRENWSYLPYSERYSVKKRLTSNLALLNGVTMNI